MKHSRGMTILEVLISLAVLAMIVVSVWSSFHGTIKGIETTEDLQKRYSIVRNGLARITSELSMAYLSHNQPDGDPKPYTLFEGRDSFETDSLTFSSFAHLRIRKDADESDQSVVQYFIEDDPEDSSRAHLFRRETRRLTGDLPEQLEEYAPAYVLIEDVVSFDVKYWDSRQQDWIDEWRTTATDMQPDRIPERVRLTVGVVDADGEIVKFTAAAAPMMQERISFTQGSS